jgi:hypothetical protein
MSLQLLAKQMEAKGRGGDSVLVHMTTGEVAGLQKLAESAGGSLSVNPDTGLVEANFLKQMLPTLVGAGVGFFTASPMLGAAAGAAVGGYQANRAGRDVGAGLVMGGLGGYGGATFGSSIQAAGAPAAASTAGTKAATGTTANMVNNAVMQQAIAGSQPAAPVQNTFLDPAEQAAARIAQAAGPFPTTAAGTGTTAPLGVATPPAPPTAQVSPPPKSFSDMSFSERASQGLRGLEALGTREGRDAAYKDLGGSESIMRALMFAGLPAMYGARTSVPQPHRLLSADINKKGFAEGGSIDDAVANRKYIIDPVTGNVILNPNIRRPAPRTFANMGSFGRKDDDSGARDGTPMTQAQIDAFDNETLAERDARMEKVGKVLGAVVPGAMTFNFLKDAFASTPQAPAPVVDRPFMDEANSNVTFGGPSSSPNIQGTPLGEPDGGTRGDGGSTEGGRGVDGTATGGMGASDARAKGGEIYAEGGLMGLAKGGMKSGGFVVPADVVSMIGEGNTYAGYKRIKSMIPGATAIKGKDGGQADTVKTSIEGKQPARVAHGEMYIPPETVKRMGGAKKLYAMMDRVRQQATGSKRQIKPVSLKRAMA